MAHTRQQTHTRQHMRFTCSPKRKETSPRSSPHPLHHSVTMVLNEERECPVCYAEYSRSARIPRVLHCGHTCCSPCIVRMSNSNSTISAVRCPLCRWISCAHAGLPLPGALHVNTDIWDLITEEKCETEEEKLIHEARNLSAHPAFKPEVTTLRFLCCVLPQRDEQERR